MSVRSGRVEWILPDNEVTADGDQRQNEQQQADEQTSMCLTHHAHISLSRVAYLKPSDFLSRLKNNHLEVYLDTSVG